MSAATLCSFFIIHHLSIIGSWNLSLTFVPAAGDCFTTLLPVPEASIFKLIKSDSRSETDPPTRFGTSMVLCPAIGTFQFVLFFFTPISGRLSRIIWPTIGAATVPPN